MTLIVSLNSYMWQRESFNYNFHNFFFIFEWYGKIYVVVSTTTLSQGLYFLFSNVLTIVENNKSISKLLKLLFIGYHRCTKYLLLMSHMFQLRSFYKIY